MKFLNYLGSLFIPTRMGQRRNMNVLFSILILLLSTYIIAVPYMSIFEKNAYETFCEATQFNFRVLDNESSKEITFTDTEINKFKDKYELTTFDELKKLNVNIYNGRYDLDEQYTDLSEVPYNGKEFLLKREVYHFDKDGTKLDQVDVYYIHIVFDLYDKIEDAKYVIKEKFDKHIGDDNHFLFVFYLDGFAYRNEYMIDNNSNSYAFEYGDVVIQFSEMETLDYITHKVSEILIPQTKTQYTYTSFIYAFLAPLLVAMLAYIFIKKKSIINTFKQYFNIAALSSMPITILFFILEWNEYLIILGIMEMYWLVFAIYYFIVLSFINRSNRIE